MKSPLLRLLPSLAVATLVVLAARAHVSPTLPPVLGIEATATRLGRAVPPAAAQTGGNCTRTATEWLGDLVYQSPSSDLTISQPRTCTCPPQWFGFAMPPTTDAVTWTALYYGEASSGSAGGGPDFPLAVTPGTTTEVGFLFQCEGQVRRPVITGGLPGVADPYVGPSTLQLHLSNLSGGPTGIVLADLAPPDAPHAFAQAAGEPAPVELPHAIRLQECSPDEPFGALIAVQQVVHGLQPMALAGVTELAQRFTVPVTCTALWFELPTVPSPLPGGSGPVTVELHHASGTAFPNGPVPITICAGALEDEAGVNEPVWRSATPMLPAALEPGQDYLLVVRFAADQFMPVLDVSGRDVLPGELLARADSNSPWSELAGMDLGMRLIGVEGVIPPPSCDVTVHGQVTLTASIDVGSGATATALLQRMGGPDSPVGPFVSGFVARKASMSATIVESSTMTARLFLEGGPRSTTWTANEYAIPLGVLLPTRTAWPDWHGFTFSRTVVTQKVTQTVDPSDIDEDCDFSLVIRPGDGGTAGDPVTITVLYSTGSLPVSPRPGLLLESANGWAPAPGADPQLGLLLCGTTDPRTTALRVLQQVHRVHDVSPVTITARLQTFTVPVDGIVRWVELPFARGVTYTIPPGVKVSIRPFDALAGSPPEPAQVTASAETIDYSSLPPEGESGWVPTLEFGSPPFLHAGQSYVLELSCPTPMTLARHVSDVSPDPSWVLYDDTGTGGATPVSGTMCFRLIGTPAASPTDVSPPTSLALRGLQLEAYPNPFGAALSLSWRGGRGAAQVEIVDVRGRVVRRIQAGDARSGTAVWDGRDSAGRLTPPGVYFATVRDGSGSAPSRRLIRIR